jgi:hypothetical protein
MRGGVHSTCRLVSTLFPPLESARRCAPHTPSRFSFFFPSEMRGGVHSTCRLVSTLFPPLESARRRAPHTPSRFFSSFPPRKCEAACTPHAVSFGSLPPPQMVIDDEAACIPHAASFGSFFFFPSALLPRQRQMTRTTRRRECHTPPRFAFFFHQRRCAPCTSPHFYVFYLSSVVRNFVTCKFSRFKACFSETGPRPCLGFYF